MLGGILGRTGLIGEFKTGKVMLGEALKPKSAWVLLFISFGGKGITEPSEMNKKIFNLSSMSVEVTSIGSSKSSGATELILFLPKVWRIWFPLSSCP